MLKPNSVCCCVLLCVSNLRHCSKICRQYILHQQPGFLSLQLKHSWFCGSQIWYCLRKAGFSPDVYQFIISAPSKIFCNFKRKCLVIFKKNYISDFSYIVSSYILTFVSSVQETKFSQNSQSYTHLHQNENGKQTHTAFFENRSL